jgi:MoxR-like ATPase
MLLADEINRTPPRTQAALLEAMQERQVTIEGKGHRLPDPFLVIATQNPVEHVGTYPLPESQLDRFLMKLTLGYPSSTDEKDLLRMGGAHDALEVMQPVMTREEIVDLQRQVGLVHVNESLVDYLMTIVHATRKHPEVELGVSTRGALTYFKTCQALAMVSGRDFVTPDDVKTLAVAVLSHRIMLRERRGARGSSSPEARFIQRLVAEIPVPR